MPPRTWRRMPLVWRGLIGLWCAVAVAMSAGAGVLQYLGPIVAQAPVVVGDAHAPVQIAAVPGVPEVVRAPTIIAAPAEPAPAVAALVARPPGVIAPPDAALMEPSSLYPGGQLPRIGPDRRMPLQAYAAGFDPTDTKPRVAILMAGIGMNEMESAAAITILPPAVSLAVSPYATRLDALLAQARAGGHEVLVSVPMEPQGYPLNDPGRRALLTGASQASNAQLLEWALTRFTGYVGATGALGEMRGERFAAAADQMAPVLETLSRRGLLYVDPRPNARLVGSLPASRGPYRGVDLVLDDPPGKTELDRMLARLEQIARDRGVAMALAGRPSPVTVDRIATWALGLAARGVTLVPVSVVVQMPQIATATPPAVRINLSK